MFEIYTPLTQQSGSSSPKRRDNAVYHAEAATLLYEQLHRRGQLGRLWAKLTRRSRALTPLASIEATHHVRAQHSLADVQTVPIAQIRGTEGRSGGFDRSFYPLQTHTAARWKSIAMAWLEGVKLPPVLLIQVGDSYFVRDGHHRVSVLKSFGQEYIEAFVIQWELSEPAPATAPAGLPCLDGVPVPRVSV